MAPSTTCAGFCKCGVFPFNPDAIVIDCGLSVAKPDKGGPKTSSNEADVSDEEPKSTSEEATGSQWSAEKVALFECRYEEGYDLPDEEYLRWLHDTHLQLDNVSSLVDYFSDLPVAAPLEVVTMLLSEPDIN